MNKDKGSPFLYFNFKDSNGEFSPFQFSSPVKILCATNINEVIPCLEEVDQAINEGYYAAGYISYEASSAFKGDTSINKETRLPLLWFGIFDKPVKKEIHSIGQFQTGEWQPTVSIPEYYKNIKRIQELIKNGKTKQVNYTIQLESKFNGDPLSFYKQLEKAQSANYSAYLDIGDFSILSASPELFFQLKDGKITTRPMKGTIGRGKTYAEDIKNAEWLKASKKNQFENKSIVDLMKNELKKIAVTNTVDVPNLYTIEKYPTVYQMTSTVTANIRPNIGFSEIFRALFPCGSITGSPKEDTMDIISILEKKPREIYCGAIGWITPQKEAIFNVPIRTVLVDKKIGKASYGVGGGITKDSIKEDEYHEVLIKSKLLTRKEPDFDLLETIGLSDGKLLVYEEHLDRLTKSAKFFDFNLDISQIENELNQLAKQYPEGQRKIRLFISKDGDYSIETSKLNSFPKEIISTLSKKSISKNDVFLYHKTTNRKTYNEQLKLHPGLFDVLLWNENNEVTEFTMGNIVVELNGELYTPPIESGLLGGTFREYLLKKGTITERKISINNLKHCQKTWFINSVREWVPVKLIL